MTTIKSYTNLEQSKKLTEILAPESADMHYHYDIEFDELEVIPTITEEDDHFTLFPNDVRCWSLAALLSVLPNNEKESTTLSRGGWRIDPIEYLDNWWCEYEDDSHTKDFSVSADNPIDACVAMIEKLYELKKL